MLCADKRLSDQGVINYGNTQIGQTGGEKQAEPM